MSEKTSPLSQNESIPVLSGWVAITEAAKLLGFTRQYCYRLAQNGYFDSIHRLGDSSTFVISTAELDAKSVLRKNNAVGVAKATIN